MSEKTYFQQFCEDYNICHDNNEIELFQYFDRKKVKGIYQIFSEDTEGNIDMLVYTLKREVVTYNNKANPERPNINNNRDIIYKLKRLAKPIVYEDSKTGELKEKKYEIPSGAKTYPFFPKPLIEKFERQEPIKTLVLTEGYKKAFLASQFKLDIVGLSSITHLKQKETKAMYDDIIELCKVCKVQNIIMLYDGDCLNISLKALEKGNDIYTRPNLFFSSACTVRELFKDYEIDIYFAHINSEAVKGNPKGIDDLLLCKKNEELEVITDLLALSKAPNFFERINITHGFNKLVQHFRFTPVETFYHFHADKIKDKEFVYKGTKYRYDDKKNECTVVIPGEARNYFRVGDQYYKYIRIPNKLGQLEKVFVGRKIGTIINDHGKNFINHIAKYEAFCNVPSHVNYTQIINHCFNMYANFEHTPEAGSCETSLQFVKHIFGEQYELGLDYLQLLYQQPTQILPILCLVSKENATGKTTFLYWLKAIFTQNCTIIGNSELQNDFNAGYASKLIIACEESFIEKKQIVEKIKAMSTAQKIVVNAKGKDHIEIDFFGKFILVSNNEDSFIYANNNDIRYWVRKINPPEKENVNILKDLVEEIPAFLNFLNERKLSTEQTSRMWFSPEQLRTEALTNLIEANRPQIEQDILYYLKNLFADTGEPVLYLPIEYIYETILNKKQTLAYIRKTLKRLNIDQYRSANCKLCVKRVFLPYYNEELKIVYKNISCRPYVFERDKLFNPKELEEIEFTNSISFETIETFF